METQKDAENIRQHRSRIVQRLNVVPYSYPLREMSDSKQRIRLRFFRPAVSHLDASPSLRHEGHVGQAPRPQYS